MQRIIGKQLSCHHQLPGVLVLLCSCIILVLVLHTPGCVGNPGPNALKRRYLGTISAKLLMYLDENLPPERLNAPHLDAIRVQKSTSIRYARANYYIRQVELLHTPGCVDNPGLNAPKRRYLGT